MSRSLGQRQMLCVALRIMAHNRSRERTSRNRPRLQVRGLAATVSIGLACAAGASVAWGQDLDPARDFQQCRAIIDDQLRLNCVKDLLSTSPPDAATASANDGWQFVRTPNPAKGPDAVSIMRTADILRSDSDLAGVMIRCEENHGLEVLLAVIRPIPPRSKRDVVVTWGAMTSRLRAEASSAGTTLNLPDEAAVFARGAWQAQKELGVTIKDPEADIHGVVRLDGLSQAMAKLSANCPK
jgi:hypothetical protein